MHNFRECSNGAGFILFYFGESEFNYSKNISLGYWAIYCMIDIFSSANLYFLPNV